MGNNVGKTKAMGEFEEEARLEELLHEMQLEANGLANKREFVKVLRT